MVRKEEEPKIDFKVMHDGRCKGCKRIVVAETEAALTDAIHLPCPHCGRVKWSAGRPS